MTPRFLLGYPLVSEWVGWPSLRTGLQCPPVPGRGARPDSVEVCFSWWLSLSISIVWSLLTVLKCSSLGSDLMCISELEGLVLVEVATLPPLTILPCKVKWNQMSNKLLAPKGSFKTRSRARVIWVRDGGFEVLAT